MDEFLKIGLPIIGSVLVVSITFFLNRIQERKKELRELKNKTYQDFIRIDSNYDFDNPSDEMDIEYFRLLTALSLSASKKVLKAMKDFMEIRNKKNVKDEKWHPKYVDLILAMRKDLGELGRKTNPDIIEYILLDKMINIKLKKIEEKK